MKVPACPGNGMLGMQMAPPEPFESPGIRKPLSLVETVPNTLTTPVRSGRATPVSVPASPGDFNPSTFTFTLRKADGLSLGLNVSHRDDAPALLVEQIQPDGAVEAWNRQCVSTQGAVDRSVRPGDQITAINSIVGDPVLMLEECQTKKLLKFTVVRAKAGEVEFVSPLLRTPGGSALRAEASEFVPGGSFEPSKQAGHSPMELATDDGACV